jgi:hypothetical protein
MQSQVPKREFFLISSYEARVIFVCPFPDKSEETEENETMGFSFPDPGSAFIT